MLHPQEYLYVTPTGILVLYVIPTGILVLYVIPTGILVCYTHRNTCMLYPQEYLYVTGFSVLCEALANGDEAMAKGKSLDYVDCT